MKTKVTSREFVVNDDQTVTIKERVSTTVTVEELETRLEELKMAVEGKKIMLDRMTEDYNETWTFMLATQDALNRLKE